PPRARRSLMDCKLVRGHLDAYVDGELEPTPVIEFEQHLDACGECRNELALARLLQQGMTKLSGPPAPASLKKRVVRALDEVAAANAGHGRAPWTSARIAA